MHKEVTCNPCFQATVEALRPLVNPLASRLARLRVGWLRSKISRQLLASGEPPGLTADEFLALTVLAAAAGAILALPLAAVSWALWLTGPSLGLCTTLVTLRRRVLARQKAILRRLPYALDLLTMCVEAGLDFQSALGRLVSREEPGPLGEEFSETLRQIKMGLVRREALRNLRERASLPALSSVTTAVIQADEMGVSMGPVLRIQAEEMRRRRFQRAEKLAMEAPIRMLLPLVGFIFPAVFIVLLGPILLALLRGGIGGF